MDAAEKCNVSGPIAIVLRISSLFGVAPLHFSPLHNPPLQISSLRLRQNLWPRRFGYSISVSRCRAILSCVWISILISLRILVLIRIQFLENETLFRIRSGLSKVIFVAITILSSTIVCTAAFKSINKMKRYISYLNKIEKVNKELEGNYLNLKMKKYSIIIWGLLLPIFINFAWNIISRIREAMMLNEFLIYTSLNIFVEISYFIKYNFELLLKMQFVFIVCLTKVTLRVLNDRLRSLIFKLKLYDAIHTKSTANAQLTLQQLCRSYVSICKLVRSIDKGEGTLVFLLLISSILDIMDSIYFVISALSSLDVLSYEIIIKIGRRIFGSLYNGFTFIFLVEPCHKTQEEFQTTQVLVSQLMCASTKREFKDELSRHYNQFTANIPIFSPLGMFVLTRQFVIVVIGGIATFLAIILQFRLKDDINLKTH